MIKSFLLYFEPFVFVSIKKDRALIYNTLNNKKLEYCNPKILLFLNGINWASNKYSKKVSLNHLKNNDIINFINDVKENYMGDLVEFNGNEYLPFQFPFNNSIKYNIESLKGANKVLNIDRCLLINLREITIYLNNECTLDCDICKTCFKQTIFCTKDQDSTNEMPLSLLEKIIDEFRKATLCKINFAGGNLLLSKNIFQIKGLIAKYAEISEYNIFYKNIINYREKLQNLDSNIPINILFDSSVNEMILNDLLEIMSMYSNKFRFTFIIQDESDFIFENSDILTKKSADIDIRPYFNKSNINFFRRNVFIKKADLFSNRLSIKQISINKILNQNNFGKITILSNGDIYSNLNNPSIGNIKNISLEESITKEMLTKKSWFKVREQLNPCRKCVYNLICPPVSNYESAIAKNNLCNIRLSSIQKTLKTK